MSTDTHDHAPSANGQMDVPPIDVTPVRKAAILAAGGGLIVFAALCAIHVIMAPAEHKDDAARDIILTYLVGFVFWASLPFGSTALLQIGYLTTASWGVVLRRLLQANMRTLPVLAVLFLPIAASLFVADGKYAPFWWADKEWEQVPDHKKDEADYKRLSAQFKAAGFEESLADAAAGKNLRPEAVEEARHKIHDYLNPGFFTLRAVVYFIVFAVFIYFVTTWGNRFEETDDPKAWSALRTISGPGVIVWALLMTWAATDWVMSVEPTWASSMFPVVFGMNQWMTVFAFSIFVFYSLNMKHAGVMAIVKDKFRIDMGTLTFGFTMVWAYATFCQYMLIWAGDLPEEIAYYRKRGDHGWELLAYFLMAFHWLIPFVVMTFREVKTNPRAMRFMCGLLLAVGAADVVWWLVPSVPHEHGGYHVPMAFAAVVMVGGLWGLAFASQLAKRPILPVNSEGRFLASWGHH